MPINTLLDELSYEEFQGWFSYFERRPVGWRADDRAAKLLQAQGVKEKPWKLFSSLDAIYNSNKNYNEQGTDMNSLKSSYLFQKMLTAKGGDKIDL